MAQTKDERLSLASTQAKTSQPVLEPPHHIPRSSACRSPSLGLVVGGTVLHCIALPHAPLFDRQCAALLEEERRTRFEALRMRPNKRHFRFPSVHLREHHRHGHTEHSASYNVVKARNDGMRYGGRTGGVMVAPRRRVLAHSSVPIANGTIVAALLAACDVVLSLMQRQPG